MLACFIYFNTEISVMGRTEISIMECTERNFCTPHFRNFCVKLDETSYYKVIIFPFYIPYRVAEGGVIRLITDEFRGIICSSWLRYIGLTDLPKYMGAMAPPAQHPQGRQACLIKPSQNKKGLIFIGMLVFGILFFAAGN
jgi:hypothetical protein